MTSLNFACKTIEMKDVLICGLGLSKTEYYALAYLLRQKEAKSVTEISDSLGKERSTVQKAIGKLLEKELIQRYQHNISSGGYVFTYVIRDKPRIKKQILSNLEGWVKMVQSELNDW